MTAEEHVVAARLMLSEAAEHLVAAERDGDPTDRQWQAIAEGLPLIWQARRALAPGTHRLHEEATR